MKHILKKRKSAAIKQKAIEQLRETRELINEKHPALLDSMRSLVEKVQEVGNKPTSPPVISNNDALAGEVIQIDRQKNIETVLKFMELKPQSDSFKQEIRKFLN